MNSNNISGIIHPELMNSAEAAAYLRISKKRLLNMTSMGQIPYSKLGRTNRYWKIELEALLKENKRGPALGNHL